MKRILLVIAAILAIGIFVGCSGTSSTSKITSASEFVEKLNLGKNFYGMSYKAANVTTTYRGIANKIGRSEAKNILEKYLRQSTEQRQAEWNKNLTNSYLEYFSEAELISIANELENSPFAEKFKTKRALVGMHMQKLSTELLKDNLGEALKNILQEASNKNT